MSVNWIKEQYPIGSHVLAANDEGELAPGVVEMLSESEGSVDGIVVKFGDNVRQAIGAEFLNEDGSDSPLVYRIR